MEKVVPIIIPSYEPDDRFPILLKKLNEAKLGPIIVVNDGSSEEYKNYFEIAQNEYGAIVLHHEVNRGKGRALKTAFKYCLDEYAGLVGCVTADSDGQHSPLNIGQVKEELLKNKDALVLGVRDFDAAGVPTKSQFGNKITRSVFKILYHKEISDTQTGLRAIPKYFMLDLLKLQEDRFEFETKMLICAIEDGVEFIETPIETIYDSKENHTSHFDPIKDSIRIYRLFGFDFGKFIISSLSSSAVDLVIFQIMCSILKNSIAGVRYVAYATIIARIISAIYNYSVNYYYVFSSKKKHTTSGIKYFLLAVVQMTCSALLTTGLIALTGTDVELLVKVPVDVVLFFVSYQIQKRFIY